MPSSASSPTTQIYTLSLHDALPISYFNDLMEMYDPENPCKYAGVLGYKTVSRDGGAFEFLPTFYGPQAIYAMYGVENTDTLEFEPLDRKSTRLNSSH